MTGKSPAHAARGTEAKALGLRLLAACDALGINPCLPGLPVRSDDGLALVVGGMDDRTGRYPVEGEWTGTFQPARGDWPDLRVAAGLGIATQLVREAHRCRDANASRMGRWSGGPGEWVVWVGGDGMVGGTSEAEALVVALEEAAKLREAAVAAEGDKR